MCCSNYAPEVVSQGCERLCRLRWPTAWRRLSRRSSVGFLAGLRLAGVLATVLAEVFFVAGFAVDLRDATFTGLASPG